MAKSSSNPVLRWFNACLPNCETALSLAEKGQEKDLSLVETVSLKYNSRLCPFCACAETKVQAELAKMEKAVQARSR